MTVRGRSTRGELLPMWHLPSSRKESSSCWVAQRRSSNQWLEESLWRDPVDWACNSRPIHVPADWVLVSPPAAVPCRRWPESSNVAAATTAWLVSRKKLYERENGRRERGINVCWKRAGKYDVNLLCYIYCATTFVCWSKYNANFTLSRFHQLAGSRAALYFSLPTRTYIAHVPVIIV